MSHGLCFEEDLPEDAGYAVATSNSLIQMLFHDPLLLLREQVIVDQCRFFGRPGCFSDIEILRSLLTILVDDPLTYFFLKSGNTNGH